MFWATVPLFIAASCVSLCRACLYRPPEDHLGVIYRCDRFSRLVGPDSWTFLLPGLDKVVDPVSLCLRQAPAQLCDLLTKDGVPVDCDLLVNYQVDLRLAAPHKVTQALRIPDAGWRSMIRTTLQEVACEVMGGMCSHDLFTTRGRHHLKLKLGASLTSRLELLGVIVDPRVGISIQMLKPADEIWQAMVDRLAAVPLGEAALARILPLLSELRQLDPGKVWEALLLEWADRAGTMPQVLITPPAGPVRTGSG
jgi:regulator of protease activity HflC (stomatin/prohibitin superfamily)